ncbi:MAG: sterol desaturase family protein [Alphaproteobacteria bacterium]|nr:sterol desaturase family protein [Alphaproteobacteria bacterium]
MIFGSLLAVALWEFFRPRRQREFPALRRRLGNLGIWLLNVVLASFTFAPIDTFRPQLEATLGVALPSWPIANKWLSFVAAFLLLDFLIYAVHRCQHAVPFLWRFHALHHSDPDVDVTTSVRHHPIEYLLAAGFYWLVVLALDIPVVVVITHGLTVFAAAAVTHSNTRLPEWLERLLQPVVITLDLHLIHHSISYDEANANFGAVLSVWDRLFGTFTRLPRAQQDRIVFGVRELPRRECLKPSAMLMTPWRIPRAVVMD